MEFLVIILFMAVSALINWLQKRRQGEQDEWAEVQRPRQTPGTAPQTRKATDWEEELRRILEGEKPAAPPPPVIREHRPVPPPIPQATPAPPPYVPPVPVTRLYRAHCEHCGGHIEFPSNQMGDDVYCPHCTQLTRLYPYSETRVERRAHKPEVSPVLPAQTFAPTVLAMPAVPAPVVPISSRETGSGVRRVETNAEVQEVLALFRNPRSARQAVIASIILNPPKALEQ